MMHGQKNIKSYQQVEKYLLKFKLVFQFINLFHKQQT
jgi:hypothetical protein